MSKKAYKKLKKSKSKEIETQKKLKQKELEHEKILQEKLKNAIEIIEDEKLPESQYCKIKDIQNNEKYIGKRIELRGFVHQLRKQGQMMFIDLRDGTGIPPRMQCVFQGTNIYNTYIYIYCARIPNIFLCYFTINNTM